MNRWKGPGYRAGQTIACKVVAAEPGGYAVVIPKDNLRGFLPTENKLKIGEEVLAQYVCVHNNRILLSARFAGTPAPSSSARTSSQQTDWTKVATGEEVEQNPAAGSANPVSASLNEAERAFMVYAQGAPLNTRLRRAIDLIVPPLDKEQEPNKLNIDQRDDLLWLITDLEGGMRTGCVKAFCEPKKSRSAVLLYRGRAVGCIYGNKEMKEPLPTENSLQMMLSDCQTPETHLIMYGLPEEVTLAMSALFLGYSVERSDDLDAKSYMDYIMSWFSQKEQTACLAFSLPASGATLLAFVHKGEFVGSFYVESQEFSTDIQFVYELIEKDPESSVEASILPPELTSSSVRLGFSLSMNMPKSRS